MIHDLNIAVVVEGTVKDQLHTKIADDPYADAKRLGALCVACVYVPPCLC